MGYLIRLKSMKMHPESATMHILGATMHPSR